MSERRWVRIGLLTSVSARPYMCRNAAKIERVFVVSTVRRHVICFKRLTYLWNPENVPLARRIVS